MGVLRGGELERVTRGVVFHDSSMDAESFLNTTPLFGVTRFVAGF
jgi:hypothetical protein